MGHLEPVPHRLVKVDGRNLPFDALAVSCNIDVRNRAQSKRLASALKDIRAYYYEDVGHPDGVTDEEWEMHLARAIHARAAVYRERFSGVELTPTALSAWWHQLAQPSTRSRNVSAREIANMPPQPGPFARFRQQRLEGGNRETG